MGLVRLVRKNTEEELRAEALKQRQNEEEATRQLIAKLGQKERELSFLREDIARLKNENLHLKKQVMQKICLKAAAKNAKASIFHIEGDPDHPVNRGALCPKGAGLVDFIHSESRLKFPEYRAPGSDKWQQISWEEAFDRIAKLMKEDRDANYIAQNAEGVTVNRWLSTGMLCASASSNETGYLTQKFSRALGMLAVDNQARV